ncbi:MAG: carboxypeptidase-like regulatory domain-containing protein [Planctomycetaceae bacterium]|jgi:hypothetical protein|nr:carboxypeptidase-like regulatory domain-containing protein [Planctomycetaceae bacterium]
MTNKFLNIFFAAILTLCLSGCGGGLTKVAGKVTLDDQPVEGAALMFSQVGNPSVMAIGTTDADGNYSLVTFRGGDKALKGAAPGSYVVSIIKKEEDRPPKKETSSMTIEERINYEMSLSGKGMKNPKYVYHVPQKYEIAEKSGLTAEVPASGSIVRDFPLESGK